MLDGLRFVKNRTLKYFNLYREFSSGIARLGVLEPGWYRLYIADKPIFYLTGDSAAVHYMRANYFDRMKPSFSNRVNRTLSAFIPKRCVRIKKKGDSISPKNMVESADTTFTSSKDAATKWQDQEFGAGQLVIQTITENYKVFDFEHSVVKSIYNEEKCQRLIQQYESVCRYFPGTLIGRENDGLLDRYVDAVPEYQWSTSDRFKVYKMIGNCCIHSAQQQASAMRGETVRKPQSACSLNELS